ncbi:MAG: type II secretion system F family protein [Nanoarchaeota archaeon]
MSMLIYKNLARRIPGLALRLRQARIADAPAFFVQKSFMSAAMVTVALVFIAFGFVKSWKVVLAIPFLFPILFMYFIRYIDTRIARFRSDVSREVVFAGRFLIIELESGVPMYNAFQNIARNYRHLGRYFAEVVEMVDFGTSMEDAINSVIASSPSPELRRMLWQVLNSQRTGANITVSLNRVIDQFVREQEILVKEYGRKLNPLAMFYMMAAIIIPSLGVVMLIVVATFVNVNLTLPILLSITGAIAVVQFIFLGIIKSSRPAVDM